VSESLTIETISWDRLTILITVSALASYSITQVFKTLLKESVLSESRFRRTSLRALSVVLGGSFGYVLGGYTGFAAIIGIGAGSLTTYVFSAVKSRVKQAAQESKDF
jgi:small-conductance mechanosensitive channel